MAIALSVLRDNMDQLLEQVAESGKPLEIESRGRRLKIVPAERHAKLANLVRHPCIQGDPEAIAHINWSDEWKPACSQEMNISEKTANWRSGIEQLL